jgi:hypothetical protein
MVPIYSILSFFSLLFYEKAVYLDLLRSCYEAFVIASFFTLMCHYVAPTLHEQKEYFRNVQPRPWIFPLKGVNTPRSGLTWFNILYIGIFQFCITHPIFTVIAFATQSKRRYCAYSSEPSNAHLWIVLLQGAFVLIALYCMLQFYKQLREDLEPHKPFLKSLCIKLVMFLCFWQNWLLSLLASQQVLHPTRSILEVDILVGIPCILICFEMTIFACLYHWAFPYTPYDVDCVLHGPVRPKAYACAPCEALLDASNPWDYAKAAARGSRWLFQGVRHRQNDAAYQQKLADEVKDKDKSEHEVAAITPGRAGLRTDSNELVDLIDRYSKLEGRDKHRHTVG